MSAVVLESAFVYSANNDSKFDLVAELNANAYHGNISSDEAKYALGNNGAFTFLVRNLQENDCEELQQKNDGTKNQFVLSFINKEGNFEESGICFHHAEPEPFFDNGRPNHVGGTIKDLAWTIMDCDPTQPTPLK